jgi:hypothetical protein
MRTKYTVKDVEALESSAYEAGFTVGGGVMRDKVIDLLQSEEELSAGFSSRNALIRDLIDLIREEL